MGAMPPTKRDVNKSSTMHKVLRDKPADKSGTRSCACRYTPSIRQFSRSFPAATGGDLKVPQE